MCHPERMSFSKKNPQVGDERWFVHKLLQMLSAMAYVPRFVAMVILMEIGKQSMM